MSTNESEALNSYMEQQQKKINELTQTILIIETKGLFLEKELVKYRNLNGILENKLREEQNKRTVQETHYSKALEQEIASRLAVQNECQRLKQSLKEKKDIPIVSSRSGFGDLTKPKKVEKGGFLSFFNKK